MWWRHLWWWLLATIKVIMTKIPYTNRSFVIVTSERSGSSLLVQLLNINKRILCREMEPLNMLDKYQLKGADSRTLINFMLAMLLPRNPWLWYTGFKLFNEQLEHCNLELQEVLRGLHHPLVIVLYRENLLETYVSLKIAFQNKIWYSERWVNNCSVKVDWDEFYLYAEEERRRWKKTMSDLRGMKKIIISFDELTGRQQKEIIYRLFAFLNVKVDHGTHIIPRCLRQNPQKLEKKIVNYHEIMERVHKSGYPITMNLLSDELK